MLPKAPLGSLFVCPCRSTCRPRPASPLWSALHGRKNGFPKVRKQELLRVAWSRRIGSFLCVYVYEVQVIVSKGQSISPLSPFLARYGSK